MKKLPRIEWSEQARADLFYIIETLSDESLQAAIDLKIEIETKVNALSEHPKKYAKSDRAPGYRQLTVRSNYLVFYRLLNERAPQIIDIVAVIHARRQWPPSSD